MAVTNHDYEELLERARERIPKDISERSRWTMPQPDIMIEGSQTILRNFSEIVDLIDGVKMVLHALDGVVLAILDALGFEDLGEGALALLGDEPILCAREAGGHGQPGERESGQGDFCSERGWSATRRSTA